MATRGEVRAAVLRLPETREDTLHGQRSWRVKDKLLVWERPLRKGDLDALGDRAPTGDVVAFRTVDLARREAILASDPGVFFTTPHFDGYPAVLARLDLVDVPAIERLALEAWLDRAPKKAVRAYLEAHGVPE
jgi:hypothetical protein